MPHGLPPLAEVRETPRVWALMGHKAGDNSQVLALAEALGWPFETKTFTYHKWEWLPNFTLGVTRRGIDSRRSSRLEGPWPDLILTAGRRNEPIARWIQKQAAAEKRVRIVHCGRPWMSLDRLDLIVTTPQYRLPQRPNVLHNKTPLHRVTPARLMEGATRWADDVPAELPRPYIAVIIGGNSGPYSFDLRAGERLAKEASALAARLGGSLLVTTSARTSAESADAFCRHVTAPSFVYRWRKGDPNNPYFAFLGLAAEIVVTGDSMSMLAEACATRKPVHIFDLGEGENAMRPQPEPEPGVAVTTKRFQFAHVQAFLYRQMMRLGPQRLSRDIRIIHSYLTDTGRAVWLGDSFPADRALPHLDCLGRAVARVRALFDFPAPLPKAANDDFSTGYWTPQQGSA
jgi:mitochondrial fission protein ELM1